MSDVPFGGKAWYPEQEHWAEEPTPWPETARGEILLADGGKIPTYFCVKCEAPRAVESKPTSKAHIRKYGADATIHICLACKYVREVAYPADARGEPV